MTNTELQSSLSQLERELRDANRALHQAGRAQGEDSGIRFYPQPPEERQRIRSIKARVKRYERTAERHAERGKELAEQLTGLTLYITGRVIARREEHHGAIRGVLGSGQWRTVEYPFDVVALHRSIELTLHRDLFGWEVAGSCDYQHETVYFNPFPLKDIDPELKLEIEISPEERARRRWEALEREVNLCDFTAPEGWKCSQTHGHERGHFPAHAPKIHSEFCGIFMQTGYCTCVTPLVGTRF